MEDSKEELCTEEVKFRDISVAIEFVCWVVLLLAPILRWINGAAVTMDQFVIQVTMVSLAGTGAVGLRIYHLLSRSSGREPNAGYESECQNE